MRNPSRRTSLKSNVDFKCFAFKSSEQNSLHFYREASDQRERAATLTELMSGKREKKSHNM